MTIARISGYVDNVTRKRVQEDPVAYGDLRSLLGLRPWGERDTALYWSLPELIDIETDGKLLSEHGIEFTVKQLRGQVNLRPLLPDGNPSASTIHVHVPNIGLLSIDDVDVLEDACTDELKKRLEAGWRILCVCPPNCQRRPDYILGRVRGRMD